MKSTSLGELVDSIVKRKAVYDGLPPEEKAEVDAFNERLGECRTAQEVLALGTSPMLKHLKKAGLA